MSFALPAALLAALVPQDHVALENGQARGDLNRDGRPDIALALKRRNEDAAAKRDLSTVPKRLLLVFFQDRSGKYRRVLANDTAILKRNEGGMLGDPFQELKIERGALVFGHSGGSRNAWTYVHRFRFDGTAWRLIGFTDEDYDRLTGNSSSRDTNLLTGEVVAKQFRGEKLVGLKQFYELRLGRGGGASGALGYVSPPSLSLRGSSCTARLLGTNSSFTDGRAEIALNVRVADNSIAPADTLRLRNARGQIIRPLSSLKYLRRSGYEQTVVYDWKALKPRQDYTAENLLSVSRDADQPAFVRRVDATIEIVDVDGPKRQVLSTSKGSYPAQIRFVAQPVPVLPPMKNAP